MLRFIVLFFIFFSNIISFNYSFAESSQAEKIGSLRKVSGNCLIVRASDQQEIKAVSGLAIFQNDIISTQSNSSLGIIFKDATRISMGPNSKLTVNQYVFNPAKKKYSMLTKMMKGTAHYVSGKLSKLAPDAIKIETPDATIGSRGTSFLINVNDN